MNVKHAQVDWKLGYGNDPKLEVLVDEIPARSDMIFRSAKDKQIWYAEKDGYVNFFSGHPDKPGNGYAGRQFTLKTPDGEVTLTGPYSSRAGIMNKIGFGPCVGVAITDDPEVMEKGHTFHAGTITLEKAINATNLIEGVTIVEQEKFDGETYFVPELQDGYVAAVDNSVVPVVKEDGQIIAVEDENYVVTDNVREYSKKDQWVVPVERDEHGSITKVTSPRFDVDGGEVVQEGSMV